MCETSRLTERDEYGNANIIKLLLKNPNLCTELKLAEEIALTDSQKESQETVFYQGKPYKIQEMKLSYPQRLKKYIYSAVLLNENAEKWNTSLTVDAWEVKLTK